MRKIITITAAFKDGTTAERRTAIPYTHAVKRRALDHAGAGPRITFHTSEEQARGIAGKRGEVVRTDYTAAAEPVAVKSVICNCGKTVIVDGFGSHTGNVCSVCGDR